MPTIATLLPNVGSTATVKDKRDQQDYTIAKLADNKYWMVENLNLAGGTALSSTDTDFESTYTLPTTDGWTTNNGKLVLPASSTSGFKYLLFALSSKLNFIIWSLSVTFFKR